jgi:spermidine/putrescine transport system substrate-binding protein
MLASAIFVLMSLGGCRGEKQVLTLLDFEGDVPDVVMADFARETGIEVVRAPYESSEEGVAKLRAGGDYDVLIMENRYVPLLVAENLLAPLNRHKIPNFKNISLSFRDLMYDPGNRYTVPYTWGTTGLLVRADLVDAPVTKWADLWDPRYAGKVAIWRGQGREAIGLTLRMLGYSANDESPEAMAAVEAKLRELRPHVLFIEDYDPVSAVRILTEGPAVISMGYAADTLLAREAGTVLDYVLPAEGAVLWGDNYAIAASSAQQDTAAQFIDYLLRPEVSARIITTGYFASANEAALGYLDPALANDPALYPPQDVMRQTEIVLPLSPEGERRQIEIWDAFVAGASPE